MSSMRLEQVSLDQFAPTFGTSIGTPWQTPTRHPSTRSLHCTFSIAELSSVALGGRVESCSDEFFAEAFHLLLVEVSGRPVSGDHQCRYRGWLATAKPQGSIWS